MKHGLLKEASLFAIEMVQQQDQLQSDILPTSSYRCLPYFLLDQIVVGLNEKESHDVGYDCKLLKSKLLQSLHSYMSRLANEGKLLVE